MEVGKTEVGKKSRKEIEKRKEEGREGPQKKRRVVMPGDGDGDGDSFHILVVGDYGSGKTALIRHFMNVNDVFFPRSEPYGCISSTCTAKVDGISVQVKVSEAESFTVVSSEAADYRDANGALVILDLSRGPECVDDAKWWVDEARAFGKATVLVGAKADLARDETVLAELRNLATQNSSFSWRALRGHC